VSKSRSNRSRGSRSPSLVELAASTIEEYRAHPEQKGYEAMGLVLLASACMAEAAWLFDNELGPEELFEHCKTSARWNLKRRADRLQAKVSAGEAHSRAAH
jgi:hypothetical protein